MNKQEQQQHQIEEAVTLITSGQETLESCRARYGSSTWSTIEGQVRVRLLVKEAGQLNEQLAQQSFEPEALWSKLKPQLEDQLIEKMLSRLSNETFSADSGSAPQP